MQNPEDMPSQHTTASVEPRSRVLKNIDDMGSFLAEYPGNTTYRFQVIVSRFCAGCTCVIGLMLAHFCHAALGNAAAANPGEIPDWFYPVVWGGMIGIPFFVLCFLVYAVRHNRKQPLLFGLFEKGFVVVFRNKTHRPFFWNEIRSLIVVNRGKTTPRLVGMIVESSPQESSENVTRQGINTVFFRSADALCRKIIDCTPHAKKTEPKRNIKRTLIMAIAVIFIVAVFLPLFEMFKKYTDARGTISTQWQIESEMTGETMRFSVYLPPGYWQDIENRRRYPVLYLLHGFRDDHTGWPQHGELRRIADETIACGRATPMIIVMPHTLGGYYGNRSDGYRYEDYFFDELIPFVEKQFQVHANKEHRAIAGISMGGQGAFYYAMKYPDRFAACCPMGGAFHIPQLSDLSNDYEQADDVNENDLARLLLKTAERQNIDNPLDRQRTFVRFYFDCGEQDGLIKINRELDAKMTELDIPHAFRTRPGGHAWECWRDALPEMLEYVTNSFEK